MSTPGHSGRPDTPAAEADRLLLERVRDGDPAALEQLVERAQRIARRYSTAVCGGAPDSEDAMQEALFRTFRHAARIREPRAFRAWLYRTVKNACMLGRRRPAAAPARLESLDDTVSAEPVDTAPRPDEMIATGEARTLLRGSLAGLSPSYREAVFLRDIEGLSTREVARVLGISQANVKVRLHRAHQQLRGRLPAAARGQQPTSEPGGTCQSSPRKKSL